MNPTGRTLTISENAMRLLERYSWPGNVRELEHTIERAVALERTDSIEPERLPEKISNYNPFRVAEAMEFPEEGINLTAHLDQLEKTYVLEALRRTGGNQTNAAELLRLSVRSLQALARQARRTWSNCTDARRAAWSRFHSAPPRHRPGTASPRRGRGRVCRRRRRGELMTG